MTLFKHIFSIFIMAMISLHAGTGEVGSKMDSFQFKVTSIDLIEPDDSPENVYSGDTFLETSGDGSTSIVGAMNGTFPPEGDYKGVIVTGTGFKIKLMLVIEGITYYTIDETINQGDTWNLSTNIADYGYTVINAGEAMDIKTIFSTPLTVTSGQPVNLGWVLQRGESINFDGDIESGITWAQQVDLVRAFTPDTPTKYVQFDLKTTTGKTNTLTILLDDSGQSLGGFSHRHDIYAMNGSFMSAGTLSTSDSGTTGTFVLTFPDSDNDSNPDIIVEGQYDCTSGQYSISDVTPTVENLDTSSLTGLICKP